MTTIEIDSDNEVDIDSIDPDMVADIRKFEEMLALHLAGEIDEDVFKVFRLANGVYGQRQGGQNQMLRVKAPFRAIDPQQLDRLADVSERYSRGWGHLTTRQNVQFHYVQLEEVPSVLWDLAAVGMTSREACSDTIRNVMGAIWPEHVPTRYSTSNRRRRRPSGTSYATRSLLGCRASSRSTSPAV